MFARKNRFSFRKGAPKFVYASPFFILRYQKSDDNIFRCAVVVGKKVDKRAVVRNKVKRAIVEQVQELTKVKQSTFDTALFMRKAVLTIIDDREKLGQALKEAFTKTNIL